MAQRRILVKIVNCPMIYWVPETDCSIESLPTTNYSIGCTYYHPILHCHVRCDEMQLDEDGRILVIVCSILSSDVNIRKR
jgi:hypothetical protein